MYEKDIINPRLVSIYFIERLPDGGNTIVNKRMFRDISCITENRLLSLQEQPVHYRNPTGACL